MKITILGDIHGNIEALKAAYAEAVFKGTDAQVEIFSGDVKT